MATKKTEEKKSEQTKKEYSKKKRDSIYYIGPTVKRGLLDNGSVFRGGLPKEVEKLKEKYPGIQPLFIPKDKYIEAVNKVRIQGTKFNILYENAKKDIGGK
jgi:hypothetical protein